MPEYSVFKKKNMRNNGYIYGESIDISNSTYDNDHDSLLSLSDCN